MELQKFKKKNRYTHADIAGLLKCSHRTAVNYHKRNYDIRKVNGKWEVWTKVKIWPQAEESKQ